MDHIKIQRGTPLSDKDLNELCRQPQEEPQHIGNGFQCYISWNMWKSMEPVRMRKILHRMLKADLKYASSQIFQIKQIIDELDNTIGN